jgi:Ca-activated chloride channel family protein
MQYASSEYLYAILLLPLIFGVLYFRDGLTRKKIAKVIGERLYKFLTEAFSLKKRRLKWALQLICLGLMLVALARPRVPGDVQKVQSQGVELLIAFDVSTSMLAEDVRPSRLDFAKTEMERLVALLPGSKIGLVPFAGGAYLASPLTTDESAMRMYINSLSPESVSEQGTSFKTALEVAAEAFKSGGEEDSEVARSTRVILFVSDGEDNEPGAKEAAEKLAEEGIRIFSLAFGTEKGGLIPMRDERGYLKGYKADKSGQKVMSKTTGKVLKEISEAGKGSFYFATFGGSAPKNIADDIKKLEQTQFDSDIATSFDEKYQIPLGLAILMGLLELIIVDRKKKLKFWKGRFEVRA